MVSLPVQEAKRSLEALRKGVPCPGHVEALSVGQQDELARLLGALRQASGGTSQVLFVRGDWGAGKSHLLLRCQEEAFRAGFLASFITLSSRETSLEDLGSVYKRMVRNLSSLDLAAGAAFPNLIASCVSFIRQEAEPLLDEPCKHGLTYRTCAHTCLAELLSQKLLGQVKKQDWCLTTAMNILVRANLFNDDVLWALACDWLAGQALTRTELELMRMRAPSFPKLVAGIRQRDIVSVLQQFSGWARLVGYSGIVLFLDEAESIPTISSTRAMLKAYLNFARILGSVRQAGHIVFVYSTTPTFYDDLDSSFLQHLRGRPELDQFVHFVETTLSSCTVSLRRLTYDQLVECGRKIAGIAYQAAGGRLTTSIWHQIRPRAEHLAGAVQSRTAWTPRHFVTEWVRILDTLL